MGAVGRVGVGVGDGETRLMISGGGRVDDDAIAGVRSGVVGADAGVDVGAGAAARARGTDGDVEVVWTAGRGTVGTKGTNDTGAWLRTGTYSTYPARSLRSAVGDEWTALDVEVDMGADEDVDVDADGKGEDKDDGWARADE